MVDDTLITQLVYNSRFDFLSTFRLLRQFNHPEHVDNASKAVAHYNVVCSTFESSCNHDSPNSYKEMVLGLTQFRSDFIDYIKVDLPVKIVTKVNKVIGVVTALFKFKNDCNEDIFLPCIAYHLESADIQLFSPQTYHQMHGGWSKLDANNVTMFLRGKQHVTIPFEKGGSNLAMIYDVSVSDEEKKQIGFHYQMRLALLGLRELDALAEIDSRPKGLYYLGNAEVESEYQYYARTCCGSVANNLNINLSGPQKEL
ncbi:hypothetical protein ACHAXS_004256 [Conticribra weissflogii]